MIFIDMNKFFFFAVALLICSACGSRPEGFVIRGSFPGLQEGMGVTLRSMEGGEDSLAAAIVAGGKFELRGKVASPQYCMLSIDNRQSAASPEKIKAVNTYLFLDNSELTMKAEHLDSMRFIPVFISETALLRERVEGGDLQREFYEYRDALSSLLKEAGEIDGELGMLNLYEDTKTPEEFNREFDRLYARKQTLGAAADAAKLDFIRRHASSPLSLYIAQGLLNTNYVRTLEEIEELTRISAAIEDTVRRPHVLKMAETAKTLYQEAPYQDVELTDAKGKTVKLSQYVRDDRYTLVDFWASWCGPCRWAIPKVEELYKRYDRNHLTVISISCDQKKADWEKAVKEEKMPWLQLWAGSREQLGTVQRTYNITGIPRLMLIAPDGKVVFSGHDANALRVTVEKYLGK